MKGYIMEGQRLNAGISPLSAREAAARMGLTLRIAGAGVPVEGAQAAEITWQQECFAMGGGKGVYLKQAGAYAALKERANKLPEGCAALIENFPALAAENGYTPEQMQALKNGRELWLGVNVPDMFRKGWQEAAACADAFLLSPFDGLDIPRLDEQLDMLKNTFPKARRIVVCPLWDELKGRPMLIGYVKVAFESLLPYEQRGLIHGFVLRSAGDVAFCPEQAEFAEKFLHRLQDQLH